MYTTNNNKIIINTNELETVCNAFRFGTTSLFNNRKVKIFLLGKGVESENIRDEKFNVQGQIKLFVENNGKIFACGTRLKTRQIEGREFCPISIMRNMLHVIEKSVKIFTFGKVNSQACFKN